MIRLYKTVWIKMFIPKPTNAPIAIPIVVISICSPNHMIGIYHEFRAPIIACVIFLPKNPINIAYITILIISMPLIGKSLTSSDVIKDISPIAKKTNVTPTIMLHIRGWDLKCRTGTAYHGTTFIYDYGSGQFLGKEEIAILRRRFKLCLR